MKLCLMIEGQEDVSWQQWREIAAACEASGIEGLFRSDHYLSVADERDRGSLDAWGTICALAASTERLRLGSLVSPVTFRHPSVLAKLVATADQVAGGGRIELGLGAGWWEAEHRLYGFDFPPTSVRMEMLAEQLELIVREWTETSVSFDGTHYQVECLDALPKPAPRPRVIVGGAARPKTVALAARWADEYNTVLATADDCRERRAAVVAACEEAGRNPNEMAFSLMTGFLLGADRDELRRRASELAAWSGDDAGDPDAFIESRPEAWIVGTAEEATEQLRELDDAGVDRVMLQHLLHWDSEAIGLLGRLHTALT